MPYVISVLTLVILAVGYTLIQSTPADNTSVFTETPAITRNEEETAKTPNTIGTTTSDIAVNTDEPATEPNTPVPTTSPTPTPADVYDYRNGTYSTDSTYRTPDGTYTMTVSLTVANDTVTNSSLTFSTKASQSSYSEAFDNEHQSEVINQDLDAINLSRVGGASLTTNAFNNAVQTIRQQAS